MLTCDQKILLLGASGGLGSALKQLLDQDHDVTAWSSRELDLNCPERVFAMDLRPYDIVINCAGHSEGTYLGFLRNDWQRQHSQIMVNYVSQLALVKHYALCRDHGCYAWINSTLIHGARPYHSVYASTKMASKFALDLIAQEATHLRIVEVMLGPTRTGFRARNFLGTRTPQQVRDSYDSDSAVDASTAAQQIVAALS